MDNSETERLRILRDYQILDTPFDPAFDRITELARTIFDTPVALVSLVDENRQWFKSCSGFDVRETPRDLAFCNYTICNEDVLVIDDARVDARTADNPLVKSDPHIVFYAGAPLISPENARLGSICVIDRKPREFTKKDQEVLKQLSGLVMGELDLRRKAELDSLTGATSRGTFHAVLSHLITNNQSQVERMAVIAFDIDHFKQINDHHGHIAGDDVLVAVVAACRSVLRECDVIARTGGEEFMVLLPDTSRAVAESVAERLRKAIAEVRLTSLDPGLSVTASFGVTMMMINDGAHTMAIDRADKALYLAKARGRNQVSSCWHGGSDARSKAVA